ncbi:MAG TPA: DUF5915 domain-containing protein, partial [Bacteroidales bacterium]|nr:DUF5915 domain-containing protein [Bacteroidales bacterium]
FGKMMKEVAAAITAFSAEDIARLEKEGNYLLNLNGSEALIELGDVEIISEDIPGWQVANLGMLTVALDTTITPQLREEGIARELINRIQNLRKDKNFEVTDKIRVQLQSHPEIILAVQRNLVYICSETLAQTFDVVDIVSAPQKDSIELTETISTEILIQRIDN